MTQISANTSPETPDRLARHVRARGLKKGFVIEQTILHHLQAISELPNEVVIPPRFVVGRETGDRLLDRLASGESPNQALQALFGAPSDPPTSERT